MKYFNPRLLALLLTFVASSAEALPLTIQSGGGSNGVQYHFGVNDTSSVALEPMQLSSPHPYWATSIATSQWVSFTPTSTPTRTHALDGEAIENSQWVNFYHTFELSEQPTRTELLVLADDTANFWVNGTQLAFAGGPVTTLGPIYPSCYELAIGCNTNTMGRFDVTPFLVTGTNLFRFQVFQRSGRGFGLNYSATIDTVPEPTTSVLLMTSLFGVALKRYRQRKCWPTVAAFRG